MAKIDISEFTLSTAYHGSRTPAYARLYASANFINDEDEIVLGSQPGTKDFYKQVNVTLASGVLTFDPFTDIDATLTNGEQNGVSYTLVLVDANGTPIGDNNGIIFENIIVHDSLASTTWSNLVAFSRAPSFHRPFSQYYDAPEIDRRLGLLTGAAVTATSIVRGVGKASAVTTDPVFVEYNTDPIFSGIRETKYVNSDASLSAAITAISSTATRLKVTSSFTTNSLTIPANVALEFEGNGVISVANGQVLTIVNGAGLSAPPDRQIFAGLGTVKFTSTYPTEFRPEWWGALGDNSTDDLAAFNAMLTSMQKLSVFNSARYIGGTVRLTDGKFYYLSGTLNVRRPVLILGGTGDYNQPTATLRFPSNTKGVVLHGLSTVDGVDSVTQTAMMSEIRGVAIKGAKGSTNSIVSTSGLTLTITGGTITAVSQRGNNADTLPAIAPGSTVTINGYSYVIDSSLSQTSTATVPIQAPRIYINATNGSAVLTQGNANYLFPSNNDWAGKAIEIDGDSYTVLSNTTTTVTLTGNFSGSTAGYTATVTGGIKVQAGQTARFNLYHGIDVRIQCKFTNCTVEGFAGNAVNVHTERYPTAFINSEPNANNSDFHRLHCLNSAGSGLVLFGINSNNILHMACNFEDNEGYGIYEEGTLGANHLSFHNAYNRHGAFKMIGSVAPNQIYACYSEGGQPTAIVGPLTMVLGGDLAAGFAPGSTGGFIQAVGARLVTDSMFEVVRGVTSSNTKPWMYGTGGRINFDLAMAEFGAAEEAANSSAGPTSAQFPAFKFRYDSPADGWYAWDYREDELGTIGTVLYAMSGSEASAGGGLLAFPSGFRTAITDPHITRVIKGNVTINPTSINAATVATQTFTLTGAAVGDSLILNPPTAGIDAGVLVCQVRVSAADTISVVFYNTTVGAIDIASATWFYTLIRV